MKKAKPDDIDSCPKCGYFLVKISVTAKCARCPYENTWINHKQHWSEQPGFKSYDHYENFIQSLNPTTSF